MKYKSPSHPSSEIEETFIWVAAEELYPLFYPNQSRQTPLSSRKRGSQQFFKNIVKRIMEESGLLYGEVDIFAVAEAIHQTSCQNESRHVTFHNLTVWRQEVLIAWAQRVIDSVIGDQHDA